MKCAAQTLLLGSLPAGIWGRLAVHSAKIVEADSLSSPVNKVVTLLKDMQAQLEKEAEEDEEVHEKMACWCLNNNRDKSKAVKDHDARIEECLNTIEATTASSARLNEEIANHKKDLTKSQASLESATAMREKQASDFNGEEKDMIQSIKALDSAIVVLSRHFEKPRDEDSFLEKTGVAKALKVVRIELQSHRALLQGIVTPYQRRVVSSFTQENFLQYSLEHGGPASGEIFGILKQMKETFENNLSETQKEELSNQKGYEDLKSAKEEEIQATTAAIEEKSVQLAESDEKNAQAKQDVEDSREMLKSDTEFLLDVKEKCKISDQEYERRTNLRQEEITAVVEAISILTSDDARNSFQKTVGKDSFIQLRARRRDHRQRQVVAVLQAAAARSRDGKLAELVKLAAHAKLNPALAKVKKAIDDMVSELLVEKKDEIKHKDNCISEMNDNDKLTEAEEREKGNLQSAEEGFKLSVSEIGDEVKTLKAEISNLNMQIKRRGEDREIENKEFQLTVADHRETQTLLKKALAVLKSKYSFVGQAPAPEFKEYKKAGAGGGVVALLEQIIAEAVSMEKEVSVDEQESQDEYESFVKESNKAIQDKQDALTNKEEEIATIGQSLLKTKNDLKTTLKELEELANTKGALHLSCDFILKNFDVRQEARDEEVEALRQAKAILSGMESE